MLPFEVLFNDKSAANIIYFYSVASKFSVTIDTEVEPSISVHLRYGTRIILEQRGGGLYYFDTTNEAFGKYQTIYYTVINKLESNKSCFHRR